MSERKIISESGKRKQAGRKEIEMRMKETQRSS
jgi:hypothetical protein